MTGPGIVGSLLVGADEMVAAMVQARLPQVRETGFGDCVAFGVVRRGVLIGGVVFNNYRGHDVHMSAAFDHVGWALPGTIRQLCDYPFNRLGVVRVTALTAKKNRKARKVLEYIGFTLEGVAKRGLDGTLDAYQYGLLRDDCKWLRAKDNGIKT